MDTKYKLLRVWAETARKLKITAAVTGEDMIALVERLAAAEFERQKIQLHEPKRKREQ